MPAYKLWWGHVMELGVRVVLFEQWWVVLFDQRCVRRALRKRLWVLFVREGIIILDPEQQIVPSSACRILRLVFSDVMFDAMNDVSRRQHVNTLINLFRALCTFRVCSLWCSEGASRERSVGLRLLIHVVLYL